MWRVLILLIAFASTTSTARAQECPIDSPSGPQTPSGVRQLSGVVEYHDSIRQWTSLKLETPLCGEKNIQLLDAGAGAFEVDGTNSIAVSRYRGCVVQVSGTLGIPVTGYYSENLYLEVRNIQPNGSCELKPPLPFPVTGKADPDVTRYRVNMTIDYRLRDGHVTVVARSRDKTLNPWQAYTSYWLTGGYVFYGQCAKAFSISKIRTTRASYLEGTGNMAALDPEAAAAKHIRILHMAFTCSKS